MHITSSIRATIFISYSHQDSEWLKRLQDHLRPLVRDYGVKLELWDDTRIKAGAKWHDEIRHAIARARVAILFISPRFFASDFIANHELPPLLLAAENGGTVVLPLILSPSRFTRTPSLAKFQAVNNPAQPLVNLSRGEQEQVLDDLSRRIELLLIDSPDKLGAAESDAVSALASEGGASGGQCEQLPITLATELIKEHARSRRTQAGLIAKASISPFGTNSYRARVTDGKGVIYCHADGKYQGQTFYVRKGIGWFYEQVLLGATSRLGVPTSNEELADGTGYPTSFFEGGYIEWSPKTQVARAVVSTERGDQTLVERKL
jgi:hypothetical protein